MTTIVFLHIPKTAGQTVHNALVPAVGGPAFVSPVRVHSQAPRGSQMPAGYKLYSGHIDWTELETLPDDRFVFTILRDPRERIASFFMYLYKEAQALSLKELALPHNTGKRRLLEDSADAYFMGNAPGWQRFIKDHYDNFYCTYFATRLIRGTVQVQGLAQDELLARAQTGLALMNGIYSTRELGRLEIDIKARLGRKINITETYNNVGNIPRNEPRWPKLMALVERDETRARLESFVQSDDVLMQRLGVT